MDAVFSRARGGESGDVDKPRNVATLSDGGALDGAVLDGTALDGALARVGVGEFVANICRCETAGPGPDCCSGIGIKCQYVETTGFG